MKLYGYFRSSAAFRVRIALNLKGLEAEQIPVSLPGGDQFGAEYRAINPQARVPTLVDGDTVVFEGASCLMHAIDRHPDCGLAPAPGRPERGAYYKWLVWMTCQWMYNGLRPEVILEMLMC